MNLILQVCLLAIPAHCETEVLAVSADSLAPTQCLMIAPRAIAEWSERHPKWRVQRWRCGPPEKAVRI
ncbi:hypothetical protein HDIA_2243 [Hartmannibacter diazotrophicus]|uniref:Uncharacterized protein n=1 Tax=Hartmannibacter diazotrophicus TaxID=1482074 RepID=A0A2C9D638_9HYPH|nr:hypothetical protein [Hartmannibacter diazotrophicus]SON55784.1 hypothetical protein HDIA_2243 [Hartmannibacter diazotrophicus]